MRILVTGATGFIGNYLIQKLIESNCKVAIITRKNYLPENNAIKFFKGDLEGLKYSIQDFSPQVVFHLAGCSIYPKNQNDKNELWCSNFEYGVTLLEVIKNIKNIKFINFNTSLAYEGLIIHPYNYYALTKATFLNPLRFYSEKFGIEVFNLILYNVYGEGDKNKRAINYIIDSLNSLEPISMSPGNQIMDFIHVHDVIDLCFNLLSKSPNNNFEDIHVGTGIGFNLREISKVFERLSGKKSNINFGAISYRDDEKMYNVAPVCNHFKPTISIESGFVTLLKN